MHLILEQCFMQTTLTYFINVEVMFFDQVINNLS